MAADEKLARTAHLSRRAFLQRAAVLGTVPCGALALARSTRPHENAAPTFIRDYVSWGAGPRASQYLVLGGKARAVINGRFCVSTEDIDAVAYPVLEPYMGALVGWKAFIAAVLGGIGEIRGAFVGGFLLGAVEIFVAAFFPSTLRDLIAFTILLIFLSVKPTGIFGKAQTVKI